MTPRVAPVRVELPAPPTALIGRERELAALRRRLLHGEERLLTLVGPPGVGKTRLAIAAATVVAGFARRCFVGLAPLGCAGDVLPIIGQALGIRPAPAQHWGVAIAGSLAEEETLLLLDNCEHVLDAAPALAEILAACPRLQVLATSRAPLHLRWEALFHVAPLELPERGVPWRQIAECAAVRLFTQRVAAVRPEFRVTAQNATAVARACAVLDGLPLAIELAACRCSTLSPGDLCEHLERDLDLLTDGARDLPPRQRSLHAALTWSYDLLDGRQQAVFRRMACFAGGATLAAAQAVCGGPGESAAAAEAALWALVEVNLLRLVAEPSGSRYVMLATIRERARARLIAANEADAAAADHATYFLGVAEEAARAYGTAAEAAAATCLGRELDNLRSALSWLAERQQAEYGLRLCAALCPFWLQQGDTREGRRWLDRFLALASPTSPWLAVCLIGVANLAHELGEDASAQEQCEAAIGVATRTGDMRALASALHGLAFLRQQRGDYAGARGLLHRAEELAVRHTLPSILAAVQHTLGFVAHQEGDCAAARPLLEEALAQRRAMGGSLGIARTLASLGYLHLQEGALEEADACYRESLELRRHHGDRRGAARMLIDLAHVAIGRRHYDEATALLAESAAIVLDAGDQHGMAAFLEAQAALAGAHGRYGAAVEFVSLAAAHRAALGTPISPTGARSLARLGAKARSNLSSTAYAAAVERGTHGSARRAIAACASASTATERKPRVFSAAPTLLSVDILTVRERQIARLVAHGRTNAAIAAELVVAEGTVANHIHRILARLGFRSRAQLAAWVAEREVVASAPGPAHP